MAEPLIHGAAEEPLPSLVEAGNASVDRAARDTDPVNPVTVSNDLVLFTLGPVYRFCGVPFSLTEQFCADSNRTVPFKTFSFANAIFEGLLGWDNLIQAVPRSDFDLFVHWVLNQEFRRSEINWWMRLRMRELEASLANGAVVVPGITSSVKMFLPYGSHGVVEVKEDPTTLRPVFYFEENAHDP